MSFPKSPAAAPAKKTKGTPPPLESASSNLLKPTPAPAAAPEKLKDLNFKVPAQFAKEFKLQAVQEGVSMVDLLRRLFAEYKQQGR